MENDYEIEQQDLNYSSLLFRHIDRLQNILTSGNTLDEMIFRYSSGVQALISMIPKTFRNKDFTNELEKIDKEIDEFVISKKYTKREHYKLLQKLFSLAIDLFAKKGYLYKLYSRGMPDDN